MKMTKEQFHIMAEKYGTIYIEEGKFIDELYDVYDKAFNMDNKIDSLSICLNILNKVRLSTCDRLFDGYGWSSDGKLLTLDNKPVTPEMQMKWRTRHMDDPIITDPVEFAVGLKEKREKDLKTITRPTKIQYYLNIAQEVSTRSTCLRRNYGAVIVKDDRIISTGYNGAAVGVPNCCDSGVCVREKMKVPHGERYELCVAVHAEQNAIIQASADEMKDATMYVYGYDLKTRETCSGKACMMCERVIRNSGIKKVVISDPDNKDGYSIIEVRSDV